MDPQAVWMEMLSAIDERDWEVARESADDLLNWMQNGGFPPQTVQIEMRKGWNRAMAEFGCRLAQHLISRSQSRKRRKG